MVDTSYNDALETLNGAIEMVLDGAFQQLRKHDFNDIRQRDPNELVLDMVFEVLCALSERATKGQIYEVFETRIFS